jgi:microsomal epoxide hydrolase
MAPITPRPFRIRVGDEVLADLQERLAHARWPDEIPDGGWHYGSDLGYMRALVEHWRTRYDWRAAEATLNAFEHFTAPLAGIDVHFIHQPGIGPRPIPLLLSHGWPGSVWEFYKIIPMLTDPARFGGDPANAFTVVAPSLPGYGFSFRPNQPRFGTVEIADVFARLMTEVLGYERFGAQGGDWGSVITARLGFAYRARMIGIHLNMTFVRPDRGQKDWSDAERAYLSDARRWMSEEAGYQRIQGTKPQTLSYALTDSPIGLAAWIVEKFRTWSDCGGDLDRRFTKDELLTNVMLYWVTGAIGSTFWPYYAFHHSAWVPSATERVETPTGIADFPCEILRPPRAWAERAYDLRHFTTMPAGGHFAALEEPDALVADIREFFRPLR